MVVMGGRFGEERESARRETGDEARERDGAGEEMQAEARSGVGEGAEVARCQRRKIREVRQGR